MSERHTEERKRAKEERRRVMSAPIVPICHACNFEYPFILNQHHTHPIGESDEPSQETVWLCPTCHALVHELRRLLLRPSQHHKRWMQMEYWLEEHADPHVAERLLKIACVDLPTELAEHNDLMYTVQWRLDKSK